MQIAQKQKKKRLNQVLLDSLGSIQHHMQHLLVFFFLKKKIGLNKCPKGDITSHEN
jgi:hypothetical protein